jgi:carboxypeptidase family protein
MRSLRGNVSHFFDLEVHQEDVMATLRKIAGVVRDKTGQQVPIHGARVTVRPQTGGPSPAPVWTDRDGKFEIHNLQPGTYTVECLAFTVPDSVTGIAITNADAINVVLQPDIGFHIEAAAGTAATVVVGTPVELEAKKNPSTGKIKWHRLPVAVADDTAATIHFTPSTPGKITITATLSAERDIAAEEPPVGQEFLDEDVPPPTAQASQGPGNVELTAKMDIFVEQGPVRTIAGNVGVQLRRTTAEHTLDQALWSAIRNRTRAISFPAYHEFINLVLCHGKDDNYPVVKRQRQEVSSLVHGVGAFQVLKAATEAFLLAQCGVFIRQGFYDSNHELFDDEDEARRLGEPADIGFVQDRLSRYLGTPPHLPYIARVVAAAFPGLRRGSTFCDSVLMRDANRPCFLELIWSYWHEEGMLVQSMNAISRRFQNVRGPGERDPLAHLEIDPLRPLNHLIWGYIQDEPNLLTVRRRAYEYDHHYGLTLYGKAIAPMRTADSRSKFVEAFHHLLHLTSIFFKEDNDTTVIADGYPLLNALREVHLLLAQGAHNQFGDLPWTARGEMLMQGWLMARTEMRDFLQSRVMVPYKEGWMPQVDTMKTLQGWSDVTVTHFHDLGDYGEQILLSVRYGDWIDINDEDSAKNWARYWRPEIQGYLHAYRAVTGIDLTNPDTVDATMPAVHLQKRLAIQQQRVR